MDKTIQQALATLESAIQLEKDGIKFYSRAADMVNNLRGKKSMLSLARDEEEHLRKLQIEYNNLENTSTWLGLGALGVDGRVTVDVNKIFPAYDESIGKMVKPEDSDIDAMHLAAKMEEDSYVFYAKAAEETGDLNAQAVYNFLADQESNHLEFVNTTLEYLERPWEWFQEQEKPILEG
jgi:rubrerythrin